jgi:mRNA interferase MazF
MRRGEVWLAATPGCGRSVLVLTRDPVADRAGTVVAAALARTRRALVSECPLTAAGLPADCVAGFDDQRTLLGKAFRRRVAALRLARLPPVEAGRPRRLLRSGSRPTDPTRHAD